ncbi:unnamed protein product [Sphagnum troendelagicum]|uniref:GATA transcription factor n=1 Tax=Sphagnum troendelagicum TaxID=128251 RepID=A0ABP0U6Q0_9BRYO
MSEADHHSQALHAHRHGTHHSTLNHSLGHGQPADSHEMHAHTQADANVQAHGEAHAQGHIDANNVHGYHVHHRHPIQHNEENGAGLEEHEDDPDEEGLDEAEMQSDSGHQDVPPQVLAVRSQESTQLTLSYQGEVYVFDTVPPEKVQAVLLLLGGREIPPGMSVGNVSNHHSSKGLMELPVRMNMPQRLASLTRFREKRKERCYDKKIRYTVRKEVAQRMHRKKGQFASLKSAAEEPTSVANWDGSPAQLAGPTAVQQEVMCVHCGIGERLTPMMRRGPAGPRTLCNACGLMWANKGVLRDLSKNVPVSQTTPQPQALLQQGSDPSAATGADSSLAT